MVFVDVRQNFIIRRFGLLASNGLAWLKNLKACMVVLLYAVCSVLVFFSSDAEAKTIALVYDDSGSMKKNERWIYANYAVQTLAALLTEGDRIQIYPINKVAAGKARKGAVTRWTLGEQRHVQIQKIHGWGAPTGQDTPYQAVVYAQEELLKISASSSGSSIGQEESNWLIITTDGAFAADYESLSTIESFIRRSGGNIRVAILLIGKNADRQIAELWESTALDLGKEGMVQVLHADADTITDEMRRIAALISGRDIEPVSLNMGGDSARFSSPFPLRRFIIIQQSKSKQRLEKVENVTVNDGKALPAVRPYDIIAPADKIFGRITQIYDRKIMPAGDYQLNLGRSGTAGRDFTVLAEAAVELDVVIENPEDKRPLSKKELGRLCEGQPLRVKALFYQAGKKVPIKLDPSALAGLSVKVRYGDDSHDLKFDSAKDEFVLDLKVAHGEKALSVEARFPQFFHLKSKIRTLIGADCTREGTFGLSDTKVPLQYVYSKGYEKARDIDVFIDTDAPSVKTTGQMTFTAEGVPYGVILDLNGKALSAERPVVKLAALQLPVRLKMSLTRNIDYRSNASDDIRITILTDSPYLRLKANVVRLTIVPKARDITIATTPPKDDLNPFMLGSAGPSFRAAILNKGKSISKEELGVWQIHARTECRITPVWKIDKQKGDILVYPDYYGYSPCFTQTGETPITLTATGPFPGETIEQVIPVKIKSFPLWRRCLPLGIKIICFVLLLLWLLGLYVKPRFRRTAKIEYQRIRTRNARTSAAQRVETTLLPCGFFTRWLIPYVAENRRIEGKRFKAGKRGRVYLPKNQQPDDVPIYQGGSKVPDLGQRDLRMTKGEKLSFDYGSYSEEFTYL